MSAITVGFPSFSIPSDPNQAMITAFCGNFNYQNLIPSISGLVTNPQSSGDFARSLISGYVQQQITTYNYTQATALAIAGAASGVNTLFAIATTGGGFVF